MDDGKRDYRCIDEDDLRNVRRNGFGGRRANIADVITSVHYEIHSEVAARCHLAGNTTCADTSTDE